ncbi:hypothetical protein [Mechercharimyces sp. CAU 1602]|nr:hypothetical protein [Mechercharimyces sp. CAU 1602]MCS1350278.1 hypothetical protein [Mechercharimyces sp. CAU 1602]
MAGILVYDDVKNIILKETGARTPVLRFSIPADGLAVLRVTTC